MRPGTPRRITALCIAVVASSLWDCSVGGSPTVTAIPSASVVAPHEAVAAIASGGADDFADIGIVRTPTAAEAAGAISEQTALDVAAANGYRWAAPSPYLRVLTDSVSGLSSRLV